MSNDLTFNNENEFRYKSRVILGQARVPHAIKFLLEKKIVKNEKQAIYLIFSSILFFLALSIFLIIFSMKVPSAIADPQLVKQGLQL